jgi:hypothetical protein
MDYKKQKNDVMQNLVKLMMNSIYGKTIQKDITKEIHIWSEETLREKFDERVADYSELACGKYIVELSEEEGVDVDDEEGTAATPSHFGVFILSYSKKIMNNFIRVIDGFNKPVVYYTDTDSLYIHKKYWDKLLEAGVVGNNMGQGKNDYDSGGIFYGLFLGSKIKYCLVIDENGNIKEKQTFKGFTQDCLTFGDYLEVEKGKNITRQMPLRWKRSFEDGIVFRDKIEKEFYGKCNENKRAMANADGLTLPFHNITEDLFELYKEVRLKYYGKIVNYNYKQFIRKYPNIIKSAPCC